MNRREVVIEAMQFRPPPYVPFNWGMTIDCARRFREQTGIEDLEPFYAPHFACASAGFNRWTEVSPGRFRDAYGVVWDRTVDKDIGTPCAWPIRQPGDLDEYVWPDAENPKWYRAAGERFRDNPDRFRVFMVGFSLYERAWTMRGMSELLMDMVERPEFVDSLLDAIVEHDLAQVRNALALDVDCVYFGDDYGMQSGLIMGKAYWDRFIKPRLAKLFGAVRDAGRFVSMHSCGRVTELLDDLCEIGLNLFNPFQPEVMDVFEVKRRFHGRLAFHGGMSVQKLLPFGTPEEVREGTVRLIELGRDGGYIFSPSHSVPRDVPPENLLAMVEVLKSQPGYDGP